MKNNKHAGATTNTLPSAKGLYMAVRGSGHVLAVAGVPIGDGQAPDAFEKNLIDVYQRQAEAIRGWVEAGGSVYSAQCEKLVDEVARQGGTPLVVAKDHRVMGVVQLKDIIKDGVREKFADLRKMGIKTIMITGDNPVTAAAIAAEAGVDLSLIHI